MSDYIYFPSDEPPDDDGFLSPQEHGEDFGPHYRNASLTKLVRVDAVTWKATVTFTPEAPSN